MRKILKNILDWLELKVSYADLRFVQTEKENIEVENGILSSYNVSNDRGVGIRVLADGAWGFAASNNLDKISLQETAAKALDIARASALTKKAGLARLAGKALVGGLKGTGRVIQKHPAITAGVVGGTAGGAILGKEMVDKARFGLSPKYLAYRRRTGYRAPKLPQQVPSGGSIQRRVPIRQWMGRIPT